MRMVLKIDIQAYSENFICQVFFDYARIHHIPLHVGNHVQSPQIRDGSQQNSLETINDETAPYARGVQASGPCDIRNIEAPQLF